MYAEARALVCLASFLLSSCSLLVSGEQDTVVYDFGHPGPSSAQPTYFHVAEVHSPPWLNTSSLRYRLAYRDPAALRAYAQSRWVAPPAMLLTLLLRETLTERYNDPSIRNQLRWMQGCTLRVTLNEFSQVFDTPTSSRGVLKAYVTLYGSNLSRPYMAQTFHHERMATSPDANGGIHALRGAADDLGAAVVLWLEVKGQSDQGKESL